GSVSSFGGTAIGDALARAVELGRSSLSDRGPLASAAAQPEDVPAGLLSIVFLSHRRRNPRRPPPPAGAAPPPPARPPAATPRPAPPGVPQQTGPGPPPNFGFGFGGNRAPDPATLRAIARATGGHFFAARTAGSLKAAYEELGSKLGRSRGNVEVTRWFLLGA